MPATPEGPVPSFLKREFNRVRPPEFGPQRILKLAVSFEDMKFQIFACLFVSLLTGLGSLHAQLSTQTIDVDGNSRTYLEYLPEGFDTAQNLPLVMSFHGGGGQAQDQLNIADLRDRADQDGVCFGISRSHSRPER